MELNFKQKPTIRRCCSSSSSKRNKGKFLFIPDDILVEILCRLPDKPLVRFKCVSKAWYLLISKICAIRPTPRSVVGLFIRRSVKFILRWPDNPLYSYFFSDFNLRKSKRQGTFNNYASLPEEGDNSCGGKVFDWDESLSSYGLPFKPEQDEFLDCCNGLLLFVDFKSSRYYVSNPATRQCVLIPQPRWKQMRCLCAALAFDPSQSSVYRIVQFQSFTEIMTTHVLGIYSSDRRIWSRHKLTVPPCLRGRFSGWFRPATYFNGSLFRLSFTWHLIRFNICEEVSLSVIELPLSFNKCRGLLGRVGVLMGKLCYANKYRKIVHIWSLEKEGSHNDVGRWILRYRINLCCLTTMRLSSKVGPKWAEPITFHPSSNIVFLGTPLVVLSYNLDDNRLEELIRIEENVILPGCFYPAFTYVRFLTPFSKDGNISTIPTY